MKSLDLMIYEKKTMKGQAEKNVKDIFAEMHEMAVAKDYLATIFATADSNFSIIGYVKHRYSSYV